MAFIFNVSLTVFVMFLIWGVVAKFRKKKSQWKFLISLLSLVIAFIVAPSPEDKSISSDSNFQNIQTTSSFNEPDEGFESKINYSLRITPEQFSKRFNDLVEQQGLSNFYHIDQINIDVGQSNVNTFTKQLTDRLGISGTVNKTDGTLGFVQTTLVPDGTDQDTIDLNNSILLLTTVIDPNITQEGIDYISYQAKENLTSENKGKTMYENGYAYTTIKTAYGLVFRISKPIE